MLALAGAWPTVSYTGRTSGPCYRREGNLRWLMAHTTGLPSLGIDLLYHTGHDFTSPHGVRAAITAGRTLVIVGLYWIGIERRPWFFNGSIGALGSKKPLKRLLYTHAHL